MVRGLWSFRRHKNSSETQVNNYVFAGNSDAFDATRDPNQRNRMTQGDATLAGDVTIRSELANRKLLGRLEFDHIVPVDAIAHFAGAEYRVSVVRNDSFTFFRPADFSTPIAIEEVCYSKHRNHNGHGRSRAVDITLARHCAWCGSICSQPKTKQTYCCMLTKNELTTTSVCENTTMIQSGNDNLDNLFCGRVYAYFARNTQRVLNLPQGEPKSQCVKRWCGHLRTLSKAVMPDVMSVGERKRVAAN